LLKIDQRDRTERPGRRRQAQESSDPQYEGGV
jgi:hypothetical protein